MTPLDDAFVEDEPQLHSLYDVLRRDEKNTASSRALGRGLRLEEIGVDLPKWDISMIEEFRGVIPLEKALIDECSVLEAYNRLYDARNTGLRKILAARKNFLHEFYVEEMETIIGPCPHLHTGMHLNFSNPIRATIASAGIVGLLTGLATEFDVSSYESVMMAIGAISGGLFGAGIGSWRQDMADESARQRAMYVDTRLKELGLIRYQNSLTTINYN